MTFIPCWHLLVQMASRSQVQSLQQAIISVSVTYWCVTNYPQTQWLKTTHIYYITVPIGQEFRGSLVLFFWFKVSNEVQKPKVLTGTGGYTSKVDQVGAGGRKPSIPCHVARVSWQHGSRLLPEWAVGENKMARRKPQCLLCPSLRSHPLSFP